MYRTYALSAGAISRKELTEFNPLTNSHGYAYKDTEFVPQPEIEHGNPAVNARPYGPGLAQRLAPPNFEIVFAGDKPVELRIGPTALTDTERHPVSTLAQCQSMAEAKIDVLRKANTLLERCTLNEAEQIDFNHEATRAGFLLACEQNWFNTSFIATAELDAFHYFSETMTGAAMRPMAEHFLTSFITSLDIKDGVGPENIARSLKIACVAMQPHLNAYDAEALARYSSKLNERVESLWQQRNDTMWNAWQSTDIAAQMPAEFSAQFKTAFLHEMNESLNGVNWNGDMALVYTAAANAAFIAGEKALSVDGVGIEYWDVAKQYADIQDACVEALNKIREDTAKDDSFANREREIKLFDPEEPNGPSDPSWDDGPGSR
ncbi:MAG: hypothetical protein IJZ68_06330 [Bacteroidaceae bacterium]|nr:hypothetical protein [Bacteroidaceae bacterium]